VLFSILITQSCQKQQEFEVVSDGNALDLRAAGSTGQGIMINILSSGIYIIDGSETWKFNEAAGNTLLQTTVTGPVITFGSGAQPPTPTQPAPNLPNNYWVSGSPFNRCIMWNGGSLPEYNYTQTVNMTKGWKFTWTYTVTGIQQSFDPKTAWDLESTDGGNTVTVDVGADIAGLSALTSKQHPKKYSFTLLDGYGVNRVQNLQLYVNDVLQASPGNTIESGVDFYYETNAGSNGNTSLLQDGMASALLLGDSFSGNNGPENMIWSHMDAQQFELGPGDYTLKLTGVIKGNTGSADLGFSVVKNLTISAQGCQ
jgi:hypothetical protein